MNQKNRDILLLVIGGLILFLPFLGAVHLFDWDEINFAESAREMIVSGDYLTVQIKFMPFWEKPPLFIWMQVLSMKVFGINEFAARFPNAIAGIITLISLYLIGRKLFNRKFGLLWALVYAGSILSQLYFHSGIIDPWFNFFIFTSLYFMVIYLTGNEKKKWLHEFLSAAFIGLGIMTKGPVALLIFALTLLVWLIFSKKWKTVLNLRFIGIYLGTIALIGGFWFILQILNGKAYLIMDFIEYQIRLFSKKDAGHGGFLFYHFVILLIGMFPASIFALSSFRKFKDDTQSQSTFRHWMMISFWVVLILFTIVKTKIIHYSSFCYFPLSFLAAYSIDQFSEKKAKFRNWQKAVLIIIGSVLGLAVISMNYFMSNIETFIDKGIIKDKFAEANLQANVHWSGFEFLIGVFLILTIVFSMWYFRKNIIKLVIGIFTGTMLFTAIWLIVVTPKIEGYTQNAAIEFFESHKGEDVIMNVWGYKSYAHYFYFEMPIPDKNYPFHEENLNQSWPKTTYLSTKITKMEEFEARYPKFKLLYTKNGFAFYEKRME